MNTNPKLSTARRRSQALHVRCFFCAVSSIGRAPGADPGYAASRHRSGTTVLWLGSTPVQRIFSEVAGSLPDELGPAGNPQRGLTKRPPNTNAGVPAQGRKAGLSAPAASALNLAADVTFTGGHNVEMIWPINTSAAPSYPVRPFGVMRELESRLTVKELRGVEVLPSPFFHISLGYGGQLKGVSPEDRSSVK